MPVDNYVDGLRCEGDSRSRAQLLPSSHPPKTASVAGVGGGFRGSVRCGSTFPHGFWRQGGYRASVDASPAPAPPPEVEVRRSRRRRRTVTAYRDGDRTVVLIPAMEALSKA